MVGTLPYMAPEQFYDTPPAPSSDLYALGVILYEMLSGRLPFSASSPAAMIQEHLNTAPPSFERAIPGLKIPAWLEAIVLKLLAKDPRDRFPSAAAVARALRSSEKMSLESTVVSSPISFQSGPMPTRVSGFPITGPTGPKSSRLGLIITAMMLLGAAATLTLYLALRPKPGPEPEPVPVSAPAPTPASPTPQKPEPVLVAPVVSPPAPAPEAPPPRKKSRAAAKKSESTPDSKPWTGDLIDEQR